MNPIVGLVVTVGVAIFLAIIGYIVLAFTKHGEKAGQMRGILDSIIAAEKEMASLRREIEKIKEEIGQFRDKFGSIGILLAEYKGIDEDVKSVKKVLETIQTILMTQK